MVVAEQQHVGREVVSFLKLRGLWGKNGNVNILKDYKYSSTVSMGGYYFFTDEATTTAFISGFANPDLTWETAEQIDLGLDARFLNNRLFPYPSSIMDMNPLLVQNPGWE